MGYEMKLASYRHGTKESFGVVIDGGIVDVGSALSSRYPSLRAVIAADRLSEVERIAAGRSPIIPVGDVVEVEISGIGILRNVVIDESVNS